MNDERKIEALKGVMASLFASQRTLKAPAPVDEYVALSIRHCLSGSPKLKKEYTGYQSFTGWYGRFVLEWLCPHCQSTKVKILKDDRYRSAQWIDGGPESRDKLGYWLCLDCSLEIHGGRMLSKVICREALPKPTWDHERTEEELAQHKRELFDESEGVLDV